MKFRVYLYLKTNTNLKKPNVILSINTEIEYDKTFREFWQNYMINDLVPSYCLKNNAKGKYFAKITSSYKNRHLAYSKWFVEDENGYCFKEVKNM